MALFFNLHSAAGPQTRPVVGLSELVIIH